ncbi:hypothetical protein ACPOL_4127 [Acidisarcina polymorpha]|uniref:Uncharacterized protein n=1 Tax=Acidisarcina polymorpha TaxID=2211140 RepID=A0A2Z5G3N1_9BACT|nr:hypothetical protein ACPOL_4127 [Acidisarcina polymorpha]
MPTTAIAPPFMKARLVIGIVITPAEFFPRYRADAMRRRKLRASPLYLHSSLP